MGKVKPGGGMENCGAIMPGGPGGKLGVGTKGAAGMMGGTKLEAMVDAAGEKPETGTVGGMLSFVAYNEYFINSTKSILK